MKVLEREIGTVEYAAGQTRTLPLPRNYAYDKIYLKLVAQLDVAAGATAGNPKDSCPAQLVQNIQVRANGRDVIKNYDMESLHRLTQIRHGVRPYIVSLASGYEQGDDNVVAVHAIIDFAMWRASKPIDTLLDSAGLATLDLIITWTGSPNDVMNDAFDGTVSVDSATLYVASLERVGIPAGTKFMFNKEYQIRSQVTATSASHQIQLPVGNLFRDFTIKTHSDGVQVNTILNNIQLKSGTEVFKNRLAGFRQMDDRVEYGLEVPEVLASAGATDHFYTEYVLDGYYILDFVKDGRLTEALDTTRLSSLELLLDVNSVGTNDFVDIYPCELMMPAIEKV
ncbi:MAG: hypothetical protein DRP65_04210 [Planctomycetota bacterium]|nr:MAG: hypothetical protein DRP65_04210 [Planctomycetota bacterium]